MLNYIFHISDLHIRNGDSKFCRYDEYSMVFSNLFISIKNEIKHLKLKSSQYVIVVSGDIFHNKNIIGNYGLKLYKTFLMNLTKIGRTIVFHGNHDKNQNDESQPSLISSTIEIKNLMILDKTQSFIIDDTGFSYVSIDDTLDTTRTCGRIEHLPSFPSIEKNVKHKIALFHGTFANVKLFNGNIVTDEHRPYPLEWIKDFDFAILGDIHLRQIGLYNKKTLWGYSGSLVQQNYGEDIVDHGYMIWNLDSKEIKQINVYNEYGMINLKQEKDELLLRISGKYENLDLYIRNNISYIPKKLDIKLYSDMNIIKLTEYFKQFDIAINITSVINQVQYHNRTFLNCTNNDFQVNKDNIIQYFKNHLTTYQYDLLNSIITNNELLLFDITKFPVELHEECHRKNKELSNIIQTCMTCNDVSNTKTPYLIKKLAWDNLFCYHGNNEINFDKTLNNTFLISGNNGTGKSAIYDIIVLSIWGDITKNKQNSITNGIINFNHKNAKTKVELIYNNDIYTIERSFIANNEKKTLTKKATIYKNNVLIKKDNACNEYINELFGTINDFLSSSMITQTIDNDILNMNFKDCVSTIDKSCNIDYIYNLYSLFKTTINKYKDMKKIIDSKRQVYETLNSNIEDFNDIDDLNKEISIKTKTLEYLTEQNNKIPLDIDDEYNKKILQNNYESLLQDLEQIEDISQMEYDKYNVLKISFQNSTETHQHDVLQFELEDLSTYNNYDMTKINNIKKQKPCNIEFIREQESMIHDFISETNISVVNNQGSLKEYEQKLVYLNKQYENLNNEIEKLNHIKPITTPPPTFDIKNLLNTINSLYGNIESLEIFCDNENDCSIKEKSSDLINTSQYTMNTFEKNKKQMDKCNKQIDKNKLKLQSIEKEVYKLNIDLSVLIKPTRDVELEYDDLTKYNEEICHLNAKYDMQHIKETILKNEKYISIFQKQLNDISIIETQLDADENELYLLLNTSEYQYDKQCVYCCKQPWVRRIDNLEQNIRKNKDLISSFYTNLTQDHFTMQLINEEYAEVEQKLKSYEMQYNYLLYQTNTQITNNKLQQLHNTKIEIDTNLHILATKLRNMSTIDRIFRMQALQHYNHYQQFMSYEKYKKWKNEFDDIYLNKSELKNSIKNITDLITYERNIKPSIINLQALKTEYYNWERCENIYNIITHNEFIRIDNKIKKNQQKNEYLIKENILKKQGLISDINKCIFDIQVLNKKIVHKNTIKEFHDKNSEHYRNLQNSLNNIEQIIKLLDTIISNFKNYRIDLYNNKVIKQIVENANDYISKMCHTDTKKFKLDYLINDTKDIIHINWLVNNISDNIFDSKQTVSVHQASGFQKFVISIALRMSLFPNCQCRQLFFDEGFTACDKLNLSIVPSFLKALLKIFNGIVIVSHIDIIQECVDISTNIHKNNITQCSEICF